MFQILMNVTCMVSGYVNMPVETHMEVIHAFVL